MARRVFGMGKMGSMRVTFKCLFLSISYYETVLYIFLAFCLLVFFMDDGTRGVIT